MLKVSKELVVLLLVLIVGVALLRINARTFADPGGGKLVVAATNTAVSNYLPVILKFGEITPVTATPYPFVTKVPHDDTVLKGEIIPLDVEHESIAAQHIHEWEFELFADETFTVTVAGDWNADFVLSILDEDDNAIVDQQNIALSENLEVAVAQNAQAGSYFILVETVGNVAGYYAISAVGANFLSSLPTAYKGILADGDIESATVAIDYDDNWFFYAEAGDIVSISVAPSDNNADMYLAIYNDDVTPDGPIIEVDSFSPGATEEVTDYEIPQNGVYMIHVADNHYDGAEYVISLSFE